MQLNSQAFLYKANGEIVPVTPKNKKSFTLKELQSFVSGYIQVISLQDGRLMILDEEGKLDGKQRNTIATNVAKSVLFEGDYIVGDALVTPYELVD
jgi:hypothetical protein